MSTMVFCCEEKLERLTQEQIISKTKMVIQGLDALKSDHNLMLHSLMETIKCLNKDEETGLVHEKSSLLHKSVEMIELGLEEAQVRKEVKQFQQVWNQIRVLKNEIARKACWILINTGGASFSLLLVEMKM